jgi:hypothetical protein
LIRANFKPPGKYKSRGFPTQAIFTELFENSSAGAALADVDGHFLRTRLNLFRAERFLRVLHGLTFSGRLGFAGRR